MDFDTREVEPGPVRMRLALHGPGVEIECGVPAIQRQIERVLAPFAVAELPAGFSATLGQIRPYDHAEVMRHLSPTALRIASGPQADEFVEVYQQDERFWLIDDRWGMAEINLLKGHWRSWLLPEPRMDPFRCTEMAVLWPLAQLLRCKGVHLLPAASAVCDGWSVLLLCPFSLEPELRALIRSGYRLVGQRRTALREEEGRMALLHMPGRVERPWAPRLAVAPVDASESPELLGANNDPALPGWCDLMAEYRCAWQNHAFCDAVLVIGSGRRPQPALREFDAPAAANLLRQAWPLPELHPSRRQGQLPLRLARQCRCAEAHLSRDGRDLIAILHTFREGSVRAGQLPPIDDGLAAA